jgi:nicotinamidase-related amidase
MMMTKDTALIIIDMQNDFVVPGAPMCVAGALATIPNIVKVLNQFRKVQCPVFFVVREHRGDGSDVEITRRESFLSGKSYCIPGTTGWEIVEELKPTKGEYRVVKKRYSSFMNTELDFMLRRLGIKNIVVCGTQYPVCVRTTIFDGVALGYNVVLVTDAVSAQTREIAEANIRDIQNIGVKCVDTQSFLEKA